MLCEAGFSGNTVATPLQPPSPELPAFLHQRMQLRSTCHLTLQQFRGEPSYVLEDSLSGQFFHLGLREEQIVRSLNGTQTGLEMLASVANGEEEALNAQEILQLLITLKTANLLEGCPHDSAPSPPLLAKLIAKNPLFIKIPLGNPDPALTILEKQLRWLFHPWAGLLAIALVVSAILTLATDLQRFSDRAQSVLDADNWIWLGISFIGLKMVHELGHGLVCKHFGGRIPDCGLFFMFFTPMTYVDATSSWAFPSRHTRIWVSAAGMLAELLVAALATLVWANTETSVLNSIAYNTIISATVITLFFNLNPLLRFDGYYILADLTEIPNLYSRGAVAAHAWFRWLLLGAHPHQHEALWIGIYGVACLIWRFLLTLSICVGAVVLLQGIGMLLAAFYLLGMLLPIFKKNKNATLPHGKAAVRVLLILALAIGILCVPIRRTITAPGVIQATDLTSVRIACPGFLTELFVVPGQSVTKNELLARLDNPEEIARLKTLDTACNIAEVEAHRARVARNPQLEMKKQEEVRALRSQIIERAANCASLEIYSPTDGIIIGRDMKHLVGSFLTTGEEICAVGAAQDREIHILIPEEFAQVLTGKPGDAIRVFLPNEGSTVDAILTRIEPRATRKIRFPEPTALAGGPIAVRQKERAGNDGGDTDRMEMLQPHFIVVASLVHPPPLRSGETCLARFYSEKKELIIVFLWHQFERLLRRYAGNTDPSLS